MAVKILDIPVYYLSKENHYNKWRNEIQKKVRNISSSIFMNMLIIGTIIN